MPDKLYKTNCIGLPVAISSPATATEALVILTQSHYYSLMKDPVSGGFLPATKAEDFQAVALGTLGTFAAWGNITLTDMSDNANFIVGQGDLHNLNDQGERTELIGRRGFLLLPVEVAVDANRDGEITFDGQDKTTAENPYRFWINDDQDEETEGGLKYSDNNPETGRANFFL